MRQRILGLMICSTLLLACTTQDDPAKVADEYWKSVHANKLDDAAKLAVKNNESAIKMHHQQLKGLNELRNGDPVTVVKTTITRTEDKTKFTHSETFDTVLVLKEGQWKVDANKTKVPQSYSEREAKLQKLADFLENAVDKNSASIDQSLDKGLQALEGIIKQGTVDAGKSLQDFLKTFSQSLNDSLDNMKKNRQKQQGDNATQQKPQQKLNPSDGEGEI